MSIIASLLGWTGLPKWATELIFVGVICAGALTAYGMWHHHIYQEGIKAAVHAEQKASAATLARVKAQNQRILHRQLAYNAQLEKRNANLETSNRALASSFTAGLLHAYHVGEGRAVPKAGPAAAVSHGSTSSSTPHATPVQDLTQVLGACAADDAELSSLQSWVRERLNQFNPTPR